MSMVLDALKSPYTFDVRRNASLRVGLISGFAAAGLSIWVFWRSSSGAPEVSHPPAWGLLAILLMTQPVVFGITFGAMGTLRHHHEIRIDGLVLELEEHVKELAKANQELQKLDHMKAQLMANVTHELKTPLVAIRGYVEGILEGRFGSLHPQQQKGLAIAARNIRRLEKLIHELLDFERIDSEAFRIHPTDFDLLPLLRMVLMNFQPIVEEKHLTATLRLPESMRIRADPEGVRRVLLNLISNAVKFTDRGSSFGVDLVLSGEGRHALVTVWDQGPGIPAEAQRHLFTRFWQADGSSQRKHGGTGLGLAIAKGILDAHGSTIRAVSTPGNGTRMQFDLHTAFTPTIPKEVPDERREAAHSHRG